MFNQIASRIVNTRLTLTALASLFSIAAISCSFTPISTQRDTMVLPPPVFIAPERQQHPLVGTLYQVQEAKTVSPAAFFATLTPGSWLLLGEQHDHPDHHQLQLWVLQQLAKREQLGAVAMEMLNSGQQAPLDRQLNQGTQSSSTALSWPERGWPFENYQAQLRFALDHASRVVAADLSDPEKTALRQNTGMVAEYSAAHTAYLAELIVSSHCGMFTLERAKPAARMQIARDQHMAQQMLANSQSAKVNVLIAGGQHVRNDIGVPLWLAQQSVLTVLMVSVAESTEPQDYLPRALTADPAVDLLWFVPALPAVDYCAALGKKSL